MKQKNSLNPQILLADLRNINKLETSRINYYRFGFGLILIKWIICV